VALGVFGKAVAFTLPKLIPQGARQLERLAEEIEAQLLRPSVKTAELSSFGQMDQALKKMFPTAEISVHRHELKIEVANMSGELFERHHNSPQHARLLKVAAQQCMYLKREVLPQLPQILAGLIQNQFKYDLVPESPILVKISRSLTFIQLEYFFNILRSDKPFIRHSIASLPFANRAGNFQALQVPKLAENPLVDQKMVTKACVKQILMEKERKWTECTSGPAEYFILQTIIEWPFTNLILARGLKSGAILTINCDKKVPKIFTLNFHFQVLLADNSCDAEIEYLSGTRRLKGKIRQTNMTVADPILLLQYDLPRRVSHYDRLNHMLAVVGSILALIILTIGGLAVFTYCLHKSYRQQWRVRRDGLDIKLRRRKREKSVSADEEEHRHEGRVLPEDEIVTEIAPCTMTACPSKV
jgi:hypothetical protein